jgi:hypothetical protein
MSPDYGTYRLTYTPPNDPGSEYPLINIEMSTSGDATVNQMLQFFEAFLAASGYILKGDLQVVESEKDPYFTSFANFDFGDQVIYGGQGTDTISFGAAQPAMEFGAKSWDDVISFG